MTRLLLAVVLFFSASCWAKPTNQLVVLTTFRLEAIKPILEAFKQDHPELQFTILHRRETSGLRLLEQADHDIDLVISSSLSLFST